MPAATVAPFGGFTQVPSGITISIASKKPSFLGMLGSIIEAICATT